MRVQAADGHSLCEHQVREPGGHSLLLTFINNTVTEIISTTAASQSTPRPTSVLFQSYGVSSELSEIKKAQRGTAWLWLGHGAAACFEHMALALLGPHHNSHSFKCHTLTSF